ncbi:hypothetical protein CRV01_08405 [Arcobacter sp. CECT 8983]|uniref:SEL1-like repeat protein n=1 Tax=Arcobacter sp. CECT 8983 TaxID=2044508 RepID=UPI00100B7E9C|nr:tetratricopeptide repeat protein [Arcobacter sp. CECT 8983]RXJ89488.1 hypothetical protein CRV01_08405 [Arcobacter sp. CECT 8983]
MKQLLYSILVFIFLTGCATNNFFNGSKYPKETLINQANNGDLNAMLELSKYFDFPQTIEGLQYFDKWYENIDENDAAEQVALLGEIYYDYSDMFLNGEEKALKLLNQASKKGNLDAKISLIKHYLNEYKTQEANEIENNIIDKLSVKQLQKLYSIYFDKRKREKAEKVASYLAEREADIPYDLQLKKVKSIIYRGSSQEKVKEFIEKTIATNDVEKITKLADILVKRRAYKEAIKLYTALIKLDNENADAYYNLAMIYNRGSYLQNLEKDKEKSNKYFMKAVELNHLEATVNVLDAYSNSKESLDKYLELKNKLLSSNEGILVLANYYKKNRYNEKARELFEKLAEENDHKAILELALKIPSNYNFNPEEYVSARRWQEFILSSSNTKLKDKFTKEVIEKRSFRRAFPEVTKKLEQEILNSDNILTLRKFAQKNRYSNIDFSIKLYEKASKAGDIKSSLELVSLYTNKKVNKYDKAVEVLQKLIDKGDKKAAYKLANLYLHPPYFLDEKPNYKKALAIYEKLAKEDDIKAIEELVRYHLCNSCEKSPFINQETGFFYMKRLYELRKTPRDYASMGWAYAYGKGVKKDLKKAEEYYFQAAQKGYTSAYYNLAWLYYRNKENKDRDIIRLDYKKAKEYLELGAKNYNYPSINLLGVFYKDGLGVKKDMQKAVRLFEKAARYDKYAANHLANYYRDKKDYKSAMKYYEYAKSKGDASAQIELGILYEKGQGTKKDIEKALKYYKDAFKNYRDDSQKDIAAYNIGLIYHYGKGGMKKDLEKAKYWYSSSNFDKAKKELKKIEKLKK